ncbi:MAG TPA: hypothetical protein VGB74_20365 [Actinoplanes sp.]
MITINHPLGALGFLAHPALDQLEPDQIRRIDVDREHQCALGNILAS